MASITSTEWFMIRGRSAILRQWRWRGIPTEIALEIQDRGKENKPNAVGTGACVVYQMKRVQSD